MNLEAAMRISHWIADWAVSPFAVHDGAPWEATRDAEMLIGAALSRLDADYEIVDGVARHRSAIVELGAIVKAPALLGPNAFVASGSYLRGGVFLDHDCIVGPQCELKSTFMLAGSKVAHLSFVGDSILGSRANIEAGAMVANYRNELENKRIRILYDGVVVDTGVDKFGALIGDDARIGANAVIAPGALIACRERVARLSLVDQYPHAS